MHLNGFIVLSAGTQEIMEHTKGMVEIAQVCWPCYKNSSQDLLEWLERIELIKLCHFWVQIIFEH